MKRFAFRLRLLRVANNYTQAGLAYELEKLGNIPVSQSTICRFESGSAIPDAKTILLLIRIFNCQLHELLDPGEP